MIFRDWPNFLPRLMASTSALIVSICIILKEMLKFDSTTGIAHVSIDDFPWIDEVKFQNGSKIQSYTNIFMGLHADTGDSVSV